MDLKLFDKKHLYNVKKHKEYGDVVVIRNFVDPFTLSNEDLVYMLKNCDAIYTKDRNEDVKHVKQVVCPNGVNCIDVIDALKTIYECDYKKARRVADLTIMFIDFYYDTQKVRDCEMNDMSDPVMVSDYKAEFNTEGFQVSMQDAEEIFALRDEALKRQARKNAKKSKIEQKEMGEE